MRFTYWNKVWVVVTLCSFLAYALYWLPSILGRIFTVLSSRIPPFPSFFWADPFLAGIGALFRFIGICSALLSVYLVWGPNLKPFSGIKKYIAAALLFEGFYFLSGLPVEIILIARMRYSFLLPFGFILQGLLVSPLLVVLSLKVWRYQETDRRSLLKWTSVAGIGYLIGIWFNNVFKWLSMTESTGVGVILSGITSLGFLNSVVTLSLSLIFGVVGVYSLLKKENRKLSARLFAIALIMLGLHFVDFILYTAITNSWKWVLLTEIWPVTLLGLGLSMLTGDT